MGGGFVIRAFHVNYLRHVPTSPYSVKCAILSYSLVCLFLSGGGLTLWRGLTGKDRAGPLTAPLPAKKVYPGCVYHPLFKRSSWRSAAQAITKYSRAELSQPSGLPCKLGFRVCAHKMLTIFQRLSIFIDCGCLLHEGFEVRAR